MAGSEAGTDSRESRKSGRVANIFGGMSGEAAGLRGRLEGLGGGQNLLATGRGGTHGCPPSTVLHWETYEEQGGQSVVMFPGNLLPRACLLIPHPPTPTLPTFQVHS